MARPKKQIELINTITPETFQCQVLEKFSGQINNKQYSFVTDQIVELTKGELQVFGPRVKRI